MCGLASQWQARVSSSRRRSARTDRSCPAGRGSPRGGAAPRRPAVGDGDAAVRAVEQRDVRLDHSGRQGLAVHGEAVVHRGDLDLAGGELLDRMVGAVMAVVHLDRARAERQRQHLVAEADAEDRHVGLRQHLLDHRHRVGAGRGRVAGTVGQEQAFGLVGEHVLGGRGRRQHRHVAAGARRGSAGCCAWRRSRSRPPAGPAPSRRT